MLILNNDIELGFRAVDFALETLQAADDIGFVGSRIVRTHGLLQEAGGIVWSNGATRGYGRDDEPWQLTYAGQRNVDYCSACFLLCRTSTLSQLDGFDEDFSPGYYEEADLCSRGWQAGWRTVYDPRACIFHFEYASFSKGRPPAASHALMRKHRDLFVRKNAKYLAERLGDVPKNLVAASRRDSAGQDRVVVVEDLVPLPRLGSGFGRSHAVVRTLQDLGFDVTVIALATRDDVEDDEVYVALPDAEVVFVDRTPGGLQQALEGFLPGAAALWVCRTHNLGRVNPALARIADGPQTIRKVLDTEAISTNRQAAFAELVEDESWTEIETQRQLVTELEGAELFDCVIAVNEYERAQIESCLPSANTAVVGHVLQPREPETTFAERLGFLFVGAVHIVPSPNWDSLVWFCSQVWPRIRDRIQRATLTIAGYWAPEAEVPDEASGDGIQFLGAIDDLAPLYRAHRVFVAPTRYAAGIPFKVHEAVSYGLPTVVTPLLQRQLGWDNGQGIVSTDQLDPKAFAEACIALHANDREWQSVAEAGQQVLANACGQERFVAQIQRALGGRSSISPVATDVDGTVRTAMTPST